MGLDPYVKAGKLRADRGGYDLSLHCARRLTDHSMLQGGQETGFELANEAVEGHILVLAVARPGIPHPPQQLTEGGISPNVGASQHRVGK